jgi:tRNA-splicing ligase RtcB
MTGKEKAEEAQASPKTPFEQVPLQRISDVIWQIPASYKTGMRVPARLFGTENILRNMDAGVFEQLTNVASLPGIVKHALCMPDGHWGYGFPIGGVAAFDVDTGIISPGGVGFDINCLAGDSKILDEHGCTRAIADMESHWAKSTLRCMDLRRPQESRTGILRFLRIRPQKQVYRMTTDSGREVVATADHPFWTPAGMMPLGSLKEGAMLAVYPFQGVPFEAPAAKVIIDESALLALPPPWNGRAAITELKKRGLLPLASNHPALPYLIKLLAYNMGDGSLPLINGREPVAWFWGRAGDLEAVRADVHKVGFTPSRVYSRNRSHHIATKYGDVRFTFTEHSVKVTSRAFAALLRALGAPSGTKVEQDYGVPSWILDGPLWHQRLFLAAYFGAEMSTPSTMTQHGSTFYMPTVGMNKGPAFIEDGHTFLSQLKEMLARFGVSSVVSEPVEEYRGKMGIKYRMRLQVHADFANLIKLYEQIGFEYSAEKRFRANAAVHYLRLKERLLGTRTKVAQMAVALAAEGRTLTEIQGKLARSSANARFIARSIYEGRKTRVRPGSGFPTFERFIETAAKGVGQSGMLWDRIERIEEIPYDGEVYDFTVEHPDHNFIANGFVLSNCGMRLVTTNLTEADVRPKLKELVDLLFKTVPAGVGSTGFVKLNRAQFSDVVQEGASWCVKNGYGWDEDVQRIEENGRIAGADPGRISERAISRGINQLGTLGSGNHYLEIQYADTIHDKTVAKKFGITKPGQVCIMVHCGSRGFGHQVATDALKVFLPAMSKYGINVKDQELACAPFSSKEGQDYYAGMACAANMAFANRQVILHRIREAFSSVFKQSAEDLGMRMVYDVAHNIPKVEEHLVDGKKRKLVVHRKGATRSFGPGRKEVPAVYRGVGQPVIVGGSMETGSYLLVGGPNALKETWGSTCHGSGRTMSRHQAKHAVRGEQLQKDMASRGIYVRTASYSGLAEEAGFAYKNISEVVEACAKAGISLPVVQLRPMGNVKG